MPRPKHSISRSAPVAPTRWAAGVNTSVAHNAHHATARHNYGLYFLWWDRGMGMLDRGCDRRYDMVRPRDAHAQPQSRQCSTDPTFAQWVEP